MSAKRALLTVTGRVRVARALTKLSKGGINEMVANMPPEVIANLMGYAHNLKTIKRIQTRSSSCTEGEVALESCG